MCRLYTFKLKKKIKKILLNEFCPIFQKNLKKIVNVFGLVNVLKLECFRFI
jgi:hypothetical protein